MLRFILTCCLIGTGFAPFLFVILWIRFDFDYAVSIFENIVDEAIS